jgi:hypothetical protein
MNGANDLIPIKAGMPRSVLSGKPRLDDGVRVWAFRCEEEKLVSSGGAQTCRDQALDVGLRLPDATLCR